jgi:hypothetical protein
MGVNPGQSVSDDANWLPEPRFSGFAEFFELEFKSVCRHLVALGAQLEEACDATQEAMIQVAQRWDSTKAHRAYVRKVAMREYIASNVNMRKGLKAVARERGVSEEASEEVTDTISSLVELDVICTVRFLGNLTSARLQLAWNVNSGAYVVFENDADQGLRLGDAKSTCHATTGDPSATTLDAGRTARRGQPRIMQRLLALWFVAGLSVGVVSISLVVAFAGPRWHQVVSLMLAGIVLPLSTSLNICMARLPETQARSAF